MDIKVALKNALGTIQTPTTAANYQATDLVPLFDSNDQLIGKISRNELMSAVKTSLGTLLNQGAADLGTSLAKIPALNSEGTLGSATVANLASVLGETKISVNSSSDLNTLTALNTAYVWGASVPANAPAGCYYSCCYNFVTSITSAIGTYRGQVCFERDNGRAFVRRCEDGNWIPWKEIAMDIPDFYKNYNDLGSLSSAIGIYRLVVPANGNTTINIGYGMIDVANTASGINAIYSLNVGTATLIGGDVGMNTKVTITKVSEYQTNIQDISGSGLVAVLFASK